MGASFLFVLLLTLCLYLIFRVVALAGGERVEFGVGDAQYVRVVNFHKGTEKWGGK